MKKFLASTLLAGSLLVGGIGAASAQTTSTTSTSTAATTTASTATKPARSANGGFSAHAPAIAKALGITTDELSTQMKAGKTIAALATEKGVSLQSIIATYVAEEQAEHPEMTAAQVTQRVTDRVNGVKSAGTRPARSTDGTTTRAAKSTTSGTSASTVAA